MQGPFGISRPWNRKVLYFPSRIPPDISHEKVSQECDAASQEFFIAMDLF
jgi:hypothetical protein